MSDLRDKAVEAAAMGVIAEVIAEDLAMLTEGGCHRLAYAAIADAEPFIREDERRRMAEAIRARAEKFPEESDEFRNGMKNAAALIERMGES